MGQEYFINSQKIEDKIRQSLPSQGGAGAGFDLSASTQIIPVIDITESAEGSDVRADLQTALSFGSITTFNVENTTATLITNTGYYRVFGAVSLEAGTGAIEAEFILTDGSTDKKIIEFRHDVNSNELIFDFNVFLASGDSLKARTNKVANLIAGCTRQIADIDGNLVNP